MNKFTLKLYPINYLYFKNIMCLHKILFNPIKERTDGRNHSRRRCNSNAIFPQAVADKMKYLM